MKPSFKITDRNGKKALWVNSQNIWDLPSEVLTEDVKRAIISAYFIGAEHMKKELQSVSFDGRFQTDFEEGK